MSDIQIITKSIFDYKVMEVIDLMSDSNDSEHLNKANSPQAIPHHILDDDFDFPEVPFLSLVTSKKNYSDPESEYKKKPDSQTNNDIEEQLWNKYLVEQPKSKNQSKEVDKEILKILKLRNAEEAARKKAEKTAAYQHLKSIKPGECMKYMQVVIDIGFQNFHFYENFIKEIQNHELVYTLKSHVIPNSLIWTRSLERNGNFLNENRIEGSVFEENQIVIVWDYNEAVTKIHDNTFVASIISIQAEVPEKVAMLVIYGIGSYLKHHKNLKKMKIKNQCQGNIRDMTKRRGSKAFDGLPIISKKELELCLTEIQLRVNCNSQLIETPQSLGLLISQYTKAIAEAPFKMQKKEVLENRLDWFVAADNRDTVRVDKDGNGLKRLWQQQLCQFNLANLEIAEAIISKYPTPLHLMEVSLVFHIYICKALFVSSKIIITFSLSLSLSAIGL